MKIPVAVGEVVWAKIKVYDAWWPAVVKNNYLLNKSVFDHR
jgi:hypothetical protein